MNGAKRTQRRGFAVLDREKALKGAAGAVRLLRRISSEATSTVGGRCRNALDGVETELNDILLFSSAKRLADDVLGDAESVAVPVDLGETRKSAAGAVKVLRNILRDARADLSVDESQCRSLDNALDGLEQALNELLPPPGSPPRAKLPDSLFDEDAADQAEARGED